MVLIIQEADQYINNIREKYGAFQLAEAKVKFDPASYNDYIQDLISAVRRSPKAKAAQSGASVESDLDDTMESSTESLSTCCSSTTTIWSRSHGSRESSTRQSGDDDYAETSDDDMDSLSGYNTSLQHITSGFDRVCKKNSVLKKRVLDLERNHQLKVKTLEEINSKLMNENAQLEDEMKNQIEAAKETHNQEMTQLKEDHQRLIESQNLAMERCKREYSQHVEDAKSNKYCMCCSNAKPLDSYVCMECQKHHW